MRSSATNRLIHAKDHGAVQINVGHLDANGTYTGEYTTFAICGPVRFLAESDDHLTRMCLEREIIRTIPDGPLL